MLVRDTIHNCLSLIGQINNLLRTRADLIRSEVDHRAVLQLFAYLGENLKEIQVDAFTEAGNPRELYYSLVTERLAYLIYVFKSFRDQIVHHYIYDYHLEITRLNYPDILRDRREITYITINDHLTRLTEHLPDLERELLEIQPEVEQHYAEVSTTYLVRQFVSHEQQMRFSAVDYLAFAKKEMTFLRRLGLNFALTDDSAILATYASLNINQQLALEGCLRNIGTMLKDYFKFTRSNSSLFDPNLAQITTSLRFTASILESVNYFANMARGIIAHSTKIRLPEVDLGVVDTLSAVVVVNDYVNSILRHLRGHNYELPSKLAEDMEASANFRIQAIELQEGREEILSQLATEITNHLPASRPQP